LVPGKKAPVLVTADMVQAMRPGSVIVDLAAEQGGNCALTEAGVDVVQHGVTIIGPVNIASSMPYHATLMYARTVVNFLLAIVRDKALNINVEDELIRGPLVTHRGEVALATVKAQLAVS
jgi:NAD(P) transhydrogenase subunit alpha